MNGLADYEAIVASGAMEVVTTVQIRIFRGFSDTLGIVHLNLKDRVASWTDLNNFLAFRTIDMMNIGDVVESCGQEIPTIQIELSDIQFEFAPGQMEYLKDCAIRGLLDGASVRVDRWVSTAGWIAQEFDLYDFDGYIEQAQPTEFGVSLSCKAWIGKIAAASYPRHIVSPWCRHELGDAGCGAVVPELAAGARDGSTRTRIVVWSESSLEIYRNGTLRILEGRNAGFVRTIEQVESLVGNEWALHLAPPGLPWPIETTIPENCALRRSCDKTLAMCSSVFNNAQRHGGFPFVPPPESV